MKKKFAGAVCAMLLCAAVPSAFAVNDLLAPKGEEGATYWSNFVKPSIRTRMQYDDNITSSKPKDKSLMGIFGPKVSFKLPYERSYMGANMEYAGRYYASRPGGDHSDNDCFLDAALRHDVSDRLSLGLKQYFAYQQQPNVVRPSSDDFQQPITLDDQANYAYFVNNVGFDYRINKWLSLDVAYDLEILKFHSSDQLVPDSLNMMENKVGFDVNYRLWTDTLFGVGYRYSRGDYDTVDKDYDSHLVSAVLRHRMGKDVVINARVGYEHRAPKQEKYIVLPFQSVSVNDIPGRNVTTSDNKNRSNEPYVELDITYLFSQATQVKVGYKLKLENSDQPAFYDRKVQGVYASLAHKLTRKTQLMFFGYQDKSEYTTNRVFDAVVPVDENLFKFGFVLTQQIKPWMFLDLGYRYDDSDSQFSKYAASGINRPGTYGQGGANTDYTRNRVFSGVYLAF